MDPAKAWAAFWVCTTNVKLPEAVGVPDSTPVVPFQRQARRQAAAGQRKACARLAGRSTRGVGVAKGAPKRRELWRGVGGERRCRGIRCHCIRRDRSSDCRLRAPAGRHLDDLVAWEDIADEQIPGGVNGHVLGVLNAAADGGLRPARRYLHDAIVLAVGDVYVAARVDRHAGRTVEAAGGDRADEPSGCTSTTLLVSSCEAKRSPLESTARPVAEAGRPDVTVTWPPPTGNSTTLAPSAMNTSPLTSTATAVGLKRCPP